MLGALRSQAARMPDHDRATFIGSAADRWTRLCEKPRDLPRGAWAQVLEDARAFLGRAQRAALAESTKGFRAWVQEMGRDQVGVLHRYVKQPQSCAQLTLADSKPAAVVAAKRENWAQLWREGQRDHSRLTRLIREAIAEDGPENLSLIHI